MRASLALIVALISALALASCGGDGTGGDGSLDDVLRYLPAETSQVIVLSTDFGDEQWEALDRQLAKGVFAPQSPEERGDPLMTDPPQPRTVEEVITEAVEEGEEGISYDDDVEALLGGDLVVGIVGDPLSPLEFPELIAVLDVGDGDAAGSLLEALGLKEVGEEFGATLYGESGNAYAALDGDLLIVSSVEDGIDHDDSEEDAAGPVGVGRALATAAGDDHLTAERFDAAFEDLPGDSLLRAYINPEPWLSSPDAAPLRELPWFAALESVAATATISDDAVSFDAIARTDAAELTDADLPLAAGVETPELVRREGEIAGASANQSQTTSFLLAAVRAAHPDSRFVRDVATLERELGIDFEREFLRQFNGPSASTLPLTDEFAARSEVDDPDRMARVLRRIAPDVGRLVQDLQGLQGRGLIPLFLFAPDAPIAPGVLGGSRIEVSTIAGEPDLYRISNLIPPRRRPIAPLPDEVVFGLVDGVFVVASDLRRAKEIAGSPSEPPPDGLAGASIFAGDLGPLRDRVEEWIGFDPGPVGEATGSLEATTSGVRGEARVALP